MGRLRDNFQDGLLLDGRYRIIAPLNQGSFGMVMLAQQLSTGQDVAIKCLTKKAAADEAGMDFAIDDKSEELSLHGRLGRHPNIVNLIESFETESHVYLVLEYCPRGDLYEAIRNGQGPLETEHVRRFMLELVDAVEYIHSKGVYHRDIKPENIFLSQSGILKLGDFGLATTDEWTNETTVGSDRYMSPEQYDSAGAGYSPSHADIWAIGVCMLNILFSRNPFSTPTEADPIFLDFSRDKQSLFDVFPNMSQDTFEVISQCMSLDPKKRSLAGVRKALRRVVSFTTLDDAPDDFCSGDHPVLASANREPLRTPSIQGPVVENAAAFPWAKALAQRTAAPQAIRQLSVIPDNDVATYTEDLFSKSEATADDWCSSVAAETPSTVSVFDTPLIAGSRPVAMASALSTTWQPKVSPMAGSLPITMPGARNVPATSMVFGNSREPVSKSWSDLWDEEEEEEEERRRQLESLKRVDTSAWGQGLGFGPGLQAAAAASLKGAVKKPFAASAAHSTTAARAVFENAASKSSMARSDDDDDTPRCGRSPLSHSVSTTPALMTPPRHARVSRAPAAATPVTANLDGDDSAEHDDHSDSDLDDGALFVYDHDKPHDHREQQSRKKRRQEKELELEHDRRLKHHHHQQHHPPNSFLDRKEDHQKHRTPQRIHLSVHLPENMISTLPVTSGLSPCKPISPTSSSMDKWVALGERRRAHSGSGASVPAINWKLSSSGHSGSGGAGGAGAGASYGFSSLIAAADRAVPSTVSASTKSRHSEFQGRNFYNNPDPANFYGSTTHTSQYVNVMAHKHTHADALPATAHALHSTPIKIGSAKNINISPLGSIHNKENSNIRGRCKSKEQGCPWNKSRGWGWNWRRDRRPDSVNVEWVGG